MVLPLPAFYDSANVVNDTRWIDYMAVQTAALDWRKQYGLKASATDRRKVTMLIIDAQNTFCHPRGELFVGGMSGQGAVDDSIRTTEFIYRNADVISYLDFTLDTHRAYAVFHPSFLMDEDGNPPAPFAEIKTADVKAGKWVPNPFAATAIKVPYQYLVQHLLDYTARLEQAGRYSLTIWPYHGMIGDKGHALVSGLAEAAFFHGIVRGVQPGIHIKGTHPLVENYSILGPEVSQLFDGTPIQRNTEILQQLEQSDVVVIAGQAKSHCVAWTIDDFLAQIVAKDPSLARKVYLLEDCMTPIVVKAPDSTVLFDYTPDTDATFERFRAAGMHLVQSTTPMADWPEIDL